MNSAFIVNALSALGFVVKFNSGVFYVSIPSHRHDIESPMDIVEECLRVYGTDKIKTSAVNLASIHRNDANSYIFCKKARQLLADNGFYESYNYSLVHSDLLLSVCDEEACLKLDNPFSSDQNCYRSSILPGLLSVLRLNIQNGNFDDKFFEIGKVAVKMDGSFSECLSIGFIVFEDGLDRVVDDTAKINFLQAKKLCLDILANVIEIGPIDLQVMKHSKIWQLGHSAEFCHLPRLGIDVRCGLLNKKALKSSFDLKGDILAAEIIIADKIFGKKITKPMYRQFSQFPRISKDISVIVSRDELSGNVLRVIKECAKKNVSSNVDIEYVKLFDIYIGEHVGVGKKALGFEISFRSFERTLVDSEVRSSFEAIQRELAEFYEIRKIL
jgi:phenylalanyl-tRNA synthetase beta chain